MSGITADQANVIIFLVIFLCVLQIFILLRITQVYWHVTYDPVTRAAQRLEELKKLGQAIEPETKEDTQ